MTNYPKYTDPVDLKGALTQAADGEIEWVKELLADGADPNGMPLIMAIQCGEPEIVRLMVEAGADINLRFAATTPLIRAVTSCQIESMKILINAGVDVNFTDEKGISPLMAARGRIMQNATDADRLELIKILIDAGAAEK